MTDAVREKLKEYVLARVPSVELLAMLAEEATELAHAALKLRRVLDGTNPTPVSRAEAVAGVREEVADVILALGLLPFKPSDLCLEEIQDVKLRRWADRLREKEAEG